MQKLLVPIMFPLVLLLGCTNLLGPDYFPEGKAFAVTLVHPRPLTDSLRMHYQAGPGVLRSPVWYVSRTASQYTFLDTLQRDSLIFELRGLSQPLSLQPETCYTLQWTIKLGWPNCYGWVLTQGARDSVVFAGLSDNELHSHITLLDSLPCRVEHTRTYTNRTKTTRCSDRYTNIQLTFTYQEARVQLHQGESGVLPPWTIAVGLARTVDYGGRCSDAGVNGISFTLYASQY